MLQTRERSAGSGIADGLWDKRAGGWWRRVEQEETAKMGRKEEGCTAAVVQYQRQDVDLGSGSGRWM